MRGYSYALAEEAVAVFAGLAPRRRARMLRALDMLCRYPLLPGTYQEIGASGRIYELKLYDDILMTWWVDHAEREVRVLRLEIIS